METETVARVVRDATHAHIQYRSSEEVSGRRRYPLLRAAAALRGVPSQLASTGQQPGRVPAVGRYLSPSVSD
jgi:hypothetical protein